MKPFHYNQDPLYAAAASVLQGQQLTEDNVIATSNSTPHDPKLKAEDWKTLKSDKYQAYISDEKLLSIINSEIPNNDKIDLKTLKNADVYGKRRNSDSVGFILYNNDSAWSGTKTAMVGSWMTINPNSTTVSKVHKSLDSALGEFKLKEHTFTEDNVAFSNIGFKQLNGLMSDDEIHTAVNSTIKSVTQKLSDSTWDVVTDIYGRRADGKWAGDWILQRKGGGSWLTIKDGGSFKAQGNLKDVLSFFEIEEGMKEGFYSQKMIKNQLQTIVRNSNTCLQMIEDDREFPEWAQSEIAVAEDGIVSVTEFMQSHNSDKKEIDEAGPETKYTFINAIRHAQKMGNTSLVKTTTSNFKAWAEKNKAMNDPDVVEYIYDFDEMELHEAPYSFKMGTATITKSGHFMDGKQVDIFHKFDDGRINAQYRKNDSKGRMVHNLTLKPDEYKLDEGSLSEETISKSVLEKVFRLLGTQIFAEWYENDFNDYIEGDGNKTPEDIRDDLENLLTKGYVDR